jgi:glycosyltransferase involved in cell wall biosynthesis
MKILLITTYFEPDSGAAAVRLTRLAKQLAAAGHQVTVLTTLPHYPQGVIAPNYRGRMFAREDRDGVRVIRCWLYATSSPRLSRRLLSQFSMMVTMLLRGMFVPRPDVALIEAQPMFAGLGGALLARLKRRPCVLNLSDLWPDHLLTVGALKESSPVYRLARWLIDLSYRYAAQIITLSPAWTTRVQARLPDHRRARVRTIYNGVDLARFHRGVETRSFREAHDLGAGPVVSFIGTFATQYDFETLFEAFDQVCARRPDVKFLIAGSGSQRDHVAALLSARPHMRAIGWLDHADMPAAWASSTVTAWAMRDHTLYHGTIPAKLYEALPSGVPIAAAVDGAAASMLAASGGGLAVKPGDAAGLAGAILRLLEDDGLRSQMARSGRAYAEAHFDPARVLAAYESVLYAAANPA